MLSEAGLPAHPAAPCAVVTGSSSGIGRAIAGHLLGIGWRVHGLDLAPATLKHANFESGTLDLSELSEISRIARQLPAAQALVHAAGVLRVGSLGQYAPAEAELMWRLHVAAASALAEAIVPGMAERGNGRVVLIGSRVSQGMAGRGQYAATKAALGALARSWASEVAASGVTVNVVSPAATRSSRTTFGSANGGAGRCSCRWPTHRDMRRQISAKPSLSSAASSRRPISSS